MVKKIFRITKKRKKLFVRIANSVLAACVCGGAHLYFFANCHVCGTVLGFTACAAMFVVTYFSEKEPDGNI